MKEGRKAKEGRKEGKKETGLLRLLFGGFLFLLLDLCLQQQ
jgi:hypothetical protein